MNKNDFLSVANKGKQQYEDFQFEVSIRQDNDGDDIIDITLYPINEYTTEVHFGGVWLKYLKDEDFDELLPNMRKTVDKMKHQAEIITSKPLLKLKNLNKEDYHCNHLLKGVDNKKTYVMQNLKDKDGKVFGFQVLTGTRWSEGIEPDCPINVKIELDGVEYVPVWSFWLDSAIYKLNQN